MDSSTTPLTSLSRRTLLASTVALAAAGLAAPAAVADMAAGRDRSSVPLPVGLRPEGITSGPGTTFYVGSLANGRIMTGDLRSGGTRVLLNGVTGRSLRGLFHDARTGLVWAVGSVGTRAHVYAVNRLTGRVAQDTIIPGGRFLNDAVPVGDSLWVTDSFVDRLARLPLTRGGWTTGAPAEFLALVGDWPGFDGTAINANGIRALSDGSLVLNNSRVGGLWRVDPATGVTTEIPVTGGPAPVSGDGLELVRGTLFNVRGAGDSSVEVLRLAKSGGRWTASYVTTLTDPTLDVPSTATFAGGSLWAVNARFANPSPATATYSVTRLGVTVGG
ncbi:MAG: hypothetical protein ABI083_17275 [Lapillicoccus sp.]